MELGESYQEGLQSMRHECPELLAFASDVLSGFGVGAGAVTPIMAAVPTLCPRCALLPRTVLQ